jgi:hypothetical protein
MAMLGNDRSHVDPNNVPLASLVAQEDHVDVNFIRNNNFNNSVVVYLCIICASPGSTASTHSYKMKYQEYKGLYYNA